MTYHVKKLVDSVLHFETLRHRNMVIKGQINISKLFQRNLYIQLLTKTFSD